MLSVQDVTFRFGGRTLLDKASLSVPAGHRVGLVGPNGTGKSTLFKLISGELTPDGGAITMVKGASLGYVRQDVEDEDALLIDIVLAADKERAALLKETETLEDPDRMSYVFDRLEQIGAYDAPSRAATILAGLGFDEAAQQRPIREYSGGWRNRVALAGALFTKPDLLMLDEPTNHLDFEAMVWLENFLQRYEETLIIISHDRDILNKTVSHIVHLENQKLTSYTGTYDQFERRRAERLMNQQALHEKQTAQKEKMMEFVRRFGAKASKASQAQSRLRAIEKMDIVDAVMADRVTAFAFPQPEELASPLITLDDVAIGYDGNAILKKLNLRIDMDDRIALLGANGNGKSTLVKLLAGKLEPMHGQVYKSGKLRVGYFAQFQTDELDVRETPVQVMQEAMKGAHESKVRAAIGRFGFNKDKADTRIGELSGGEKARLLFCLMSRDAPHIMLLDEPTNHLDMDAREALMQALNNYEGAVILVSHDPHLVGAVADRLWLVADGVCKPFDGDLDEYKAQVVRQRRKEKDSARAEKASKKKGRSAPADEAEALERRIAELTAERNGLENELSVASEKGDGKAIGRLSTSHAAVEKTLAEETAKLEALIAAL